MVKGGWGFIVGRALAVWFAVITLRELGAVNGMVNQARASSSRGVDIYVLAAMQTAVALATAVLAALLMARPSEVAELAPRLGESVNGFELNGGSSLKNALGVAVGWAFFLSGLISVLDALIEKWLIAELRMESLRFLQQDWIKPLTFPHSA